MFEFSDVMRNTRQGPQGSEGSKDPTLQQIMETIRAHQAANEEAKADQLRPFHERGTWQTSSFISVKIFLLNAFFLNNVMVKFC